MTGGSSEEHFQLYRQRGQAENFIKEMKAGFFSDKTDSSTMLKNEVRMILSCIAYNLFLFLKQSCWWRYKKVNHQAFSSIVRDDCWKMCSDRKKTDPENVTVVCLIKSGLGTYFISFPT